MARFLCESTSAADDGAGAVGNDDKSAAEGGAAVAAVNVVGGADCALGVETVDEDAGRVDVGHFLQ